MRIRGGGDEGDDSNEFIDDGRFVSSRNLIQGNMGLGTTFEYDFVALNVRSSYTSTIIGQNEDHYLLEFVNSNYPNTPSVNEPEKNSIVRTFAIMMHKETGNIDFAKNLGASDEMEGANIWMQVVESTPSEEVSLKIVSGVLNGNPVIFKITIHSIYYAYDATWTFKSVQTTSPELYTPSSELWSVYVYDIEEVSDFRIYVIDGTYKYTYVAEGPNVYYFRLIIDLVSEMYNGTESTLYSAHILESFIPDNLDGMSQEIVEIETMNGLIELTKYTISLEGVDFQTYYIGSDGVLYQVETHVMYMKMDMMLTALFFDDSGAYDGPESKIISGDGDNNSFYSDFGFEVYRDRTLMQGNMGLGTTFEYNFTEGAVLNYEVKIVGQNEDHYVIEFNWSIRTGEYSSSGYNYCFMMHKETGDIDFAASLGDSETIPGAKKWKVIMEEFGELGEAYMILTTSVIDGKPVIQEFSFFENMFGSTGSITGQFTQVNVEAPEPYSPSSMLWEGFVLTATQRAPWEDYDGVLKCIIVGEGNGEIYALVVGIVTFTDPDGEELGSLKMSSISTYGLTDTTGYTQSVVMIDTPDGPLEVTKYVNESVGSNSRYVYTYYVGSNGLIYKETYESYENGELIGYSISEITELIHP